MINESPCLLVKTIQVYMIWCIIFLSMIDMVDLLYSVFIFDWWGCWRNNCILFMPVKENGYHVRVCLTLISRTYSRYFLFLLSCQIRVFKKIVIRTMLSLYSMLVAKNYKTRYISNMFLWSNCNDCYSFIKVCVVNYVP